VSIYDNRIRALRQAGAQQASDPSELAQLAHSIRHVEAASRDRVCDRVELERGQRSGGHNRKSSVVRLVTGNPGRRPLNKQQPQPKSSMPKCPSHLDAEAKLEWRRVAPKLFELGLLTEIDGEALAAYCSSWSIWVQAKEHLAEEGLTVVGPRGGVRASPWIAIARGAQRDLQSLAAEFGLTPLSRQRIHVTPPEKPDPFEELLRS
jgi:P27 family predicted phage terminase small subunit